MRKSFGTAAAVVFAVGAGSARAQEKPPAPLPPPTKEEPAPKPVGPRPQEGPPPRPVAPRPQEEPPPKGVTPRPGEPIPSSPMDPASPDFFGFALGDINDQQIVGDERVLAATGTIAQPIWVKLPGFEVRCESLVLWGDSGRLEDARKHRDALKKAKPEELLGPMLHAVYAEGGVHVRMRNQTIDADRVFLDFQHGKAFMVRAKLTGKIEGRLGGRAMPLTVRADVVRATSRDKYRAERASVSTCDFADPHYHFETESLDVDWSKDFASFSTSWWPTVRMDTVVAKDTPILTFPKLSGSTGLASTPIQGLNVSHGSRFGWTVETTWGTDLRRDDGSKWGEWRLHLDERTRRGPGAGLDVEHRAKSSHPGGPRDEFEFQGYWQRDRADFDKYSDRAFDGGLDPDTNRSDRGFAHVWNRWHVENESIVNTLGRGWRVDSEVSWYSDRGYFGEYDSRKTQTEKQQETFVQARKIWGNQGVSILGSYRLNEEAASLRNRPADLVLTDFENQTQYAPSATYHLIDHPVVSAEGTGLFPVNVSVQANVANVKRRYDDVAADGFDGLLDWRGRWVRRGDLETRVATPFSLGDVTFSPAFGGSIYGVDEANGFGNPGADGEGRYSAFWNLRADVQAWKLYPDVRSGFFDLDGLRHVASLDAQVFQRFKVSDEPFTFQSNDKIDDLVEQRIASLRLRNRLQTKRDGEVADWLDYEARFLYLFRSSEAGAAGVFGVREDFPQTLQALDFPGEGKYSFADRDGSAFWQHRARMQVTEGFWLVGEADYDFQANAFETTGAGLRWFADKKLSFYVGRRTIHGDSTIWTERADYKLSEKWGVGVEHQRDSRNSEALRTMFSLYRRAHDYTIAVELRADRQSDDRAVLFAIYPNDYLGSRVDPFSLRRPLDYAALKWYR